MKKVLSLSLSIIMIMSFFVAISPVKPVQAASVKNVTLSFLLAWNGGGTNAPTDQTENAVAKVIKQKTGVTLDMQFITTPENERLNLAFASGDVPDIVNAPFWGASDPDTIILKKAAMEGLILPLDDLINKYGPNIKPALSKGVAKDFKENDLEDPAFNGKHYFIPQQTPASVEDYTNWGVANYVRQDILTALKVKATDIKTSDDLYKLLKRIKAGNFKDINGKPVIPAGTWAGGWSYAPLTNSFFDNNLAGFSKVNGKWRLAAFSPLIDKQVLFMRKLVSEGLFDPEAFTQNDTVATQKMATGRVALVGAHYFYMREKLSQTLYKSHPEMKYVAVCVKDANGENLQIAHKVMNGRAGCPVIFLSQNNKDPEATIKFLNFMNSDEGKLLAYYGISGTTYNMVNRKPRMTKEWVDKYNTNPKSLYDMGIGSTYTSFISLDDRMSKYGEITPGTADKKDQDYEAVKKMAPLKLVDGYRMSYFKNLYPKASDIDTLTAWNTYNDTLTKSYFAKTDKDALAILNGYRNMLNKGGIKDYEKFINDKASKRKDVIN